MTWILRRGLLAVIFVFAVAVAASATTVTLVDNTSGQTTINSHTLEATGPISGEFSEDVSSSSYNLESGAPGYRLSGQLQIGGMTKYDDGDTSWAEVVLSPTVPSIDTTFGWNTGINFVFQGSTTSGTAGYGYEFWLREGTTNLGYFHTNNVVRSNLEHETGAPNPRSVFFDFALTVVPSGGGGGGRAYLDIDYAGSTIGSLSGVYSSTSLSSAYAYAGLYCYENETEFAFLDYSTGGVEGQLDLSPIPEPISMIFFGTGLVGVLGYVARRRMRRS